MRGVVGGFGWFVALPEKRKRSQVWGGESVLVPCPRVGNEMSVGDSVGLA